MVTDADKLRFGTLPTRKSGNQDQISLPEALAWIAFRRAMTGDDLRRACEGEKAVIAERSDEWFEEQLRAIFSSDGFFAPVVPGTGPFTDRNRGLELLAEALQKLIQGVECDRIELTAVYVPEWSAPDLSYPARVALAKEILRNFKQFDLSTGGLRRGPESETTSIMWSHHDQATDRELDALIGNNQNGRDGYLDIKVCRADLMKCFPAHDGSLVGDVANAPLVGSVTPTKVSPGPNKDPIVIEAIEYVTQQCLNAGYKIPLKRGEYQSFKDQIMSRISEKSNHAMTRSDRALRNYADEVYQALPKG
jgi:hypothetical protein